MVMQIKLVVVVVVFYHQLDVNDIRKQKCHRLESKNIYKDIFSLKSSEMMRKQYCYRKKSITVFFLPLPVSNVFWGVFFQMAYLIPSHQRWKTVKSAYEPSGSSDRSLSRFL